MNGKQREAPAGSSDGTGASLRLDKWLWFARFFKTRTLATKFVQSGKVRLNKVVQSKPHYGVRAGDVLTFPMHLGIKVVRIVALGQRRGPAKEAQLLYEDLSPPPVPKDSDGGADGQFAKVAPRDPGSGRPTKRQRRETERLRGGEHKAG